MTSAIEPARDDGPAQTTQSRPSKRLYRSTSQRVVAGICGGLGEYFDTDPIWFRIGFVILALGGGSGILAYLLMWIIVQPAPEGYAPSSAQRGSLPGAAIVGLVFMVVGTVAFVNTAAPWLGPYVWPVVLVLGGVALLLGGINHDDRR
jgi:phage shock protein C